MDIVEQLKRQAQEIASEGFNGWGNTMLIAAEEIEQLRGVVAMKNAGKNKPPNAVLNGTRRKKPEDHLWDALLAVCGLNGSIPTLSERGAWNKSVQALRAVKATPQEIQARGTAYRKRWPNVSLTPTALARRWNECIATITPSVSKERLPDDYYKPDGTVNTKYA